MPRLNWVELNEPQFNFIDPEFLRFFLRVL